MTGRMITALAAEVRDHIPSHFSAALASVAGLSVEQLQLAARGQYPLRGWQVINLARHMRIADAMRVAAAKSYDADSAII